jgi:glycosyltransferase involved in cell wall biosynthesis
MSKKKLVFFDFITHYGGAQRSTVLLCERLKPFYDIQIIDAYGYCGPYLAEISSNALPLHVLNGSNSDVVIGHNTALHLRFLSLARQTPHLISLIFKLNKTINQIAPDLIWTNSAKALFCLSFCKKFNKAMLGFYTRTWSLKKQVNWWQRFLIRKYVDLIFSVSNPTRKAMVSWGVDSRKIDVVHPAMDFDRLKNSPTKYIKHPLKKKLDFFILLPATLLHAKGQHTVIGAVKWLKARNLNRRYHVWFAGDVGIGDTSGYLQRLKSLVQNSGLENEVHFLGWRNDIPDLMIRADVVVLPSHTEGLPRVIQEAIMLRRPVIATRVGGIPDLIQDGKTGFLVNIEEEVALAEKIQFIAENGDIVDAMANHAYEQYVLRFNSDLQLDRFRSTVEEALATHH